MSNKVVWHLLSNRWNSAITEYALSAARALQTVGHHSIFTALEGSPGERRAQSMGLQVESIPGFAFNQLWKLRCKAKEIRPDCIIHYGGPETFIGKLLPVRRQVRFFGQDLRSSIFDGSGFFSAYSHIERFIVPNSNLEKSVQKIAQKKPVKRILLGLDIPELKIDKSETKSHDLMILGRLDPVKGHANFLSIFAKVCQIWPKDMNLPTLHIVGQEANLSFAELKELISLNGLELGIHVFLTGERIVGLPHLMQATNIGVISSVGSEHICRVAEEFLLCGTPVLVSGAGATEEVLFPGAGESYSGLSNESAAQQLIQMILEARTESVLKRGERTQEAGERFSLKRMGRDLDAYLFQ